MCVLFPEPAAAVCGSDVRGLQSGPRQQNNHHGDAPPPGRTAAGLHPPLQVSGGGGRGADVSARDVSITGRWVDTS